MYCVWFWMFRRETNLGLTSNIGRNFFVGASPFVQAAMEYKLRIYTLQIPKRYYRAKFLRNAILYKLGAKQTVHYQFQATMNNCLLLTLWSTVFPFSLSDSSCTEKKIILSCRTLIWILCDFLISLSLNFFQ